MSHQETLSKFLLGKNPGDIEEFQELIDSMAEELKEELVTAKDGDVKLVQGGILNLRRLSSDLVKREYSLPANNGSGYFKVSPNN